MFYSCILTTMSSDDGVTVILFAGCSSTLFPGAKSGLCITRQPQSQTVTEGDSLFLECLAEANPPAQFHWYHNMKAMVQQKGSVLRVGAF